MTTLIERLRSGYVSSGLMREAADRIEKLEAELRNAGIYLIEIAKPLTPEQAKLVNPKDLETRWANYTDQGPKSWEGWTFMGRQHYGNPYNPDLCCLLWVKPKAREVKP